MNISSHGGTVPDPVINVHPMTTRAKAGIHKPKVFAAHVFPKNAQAALSNSNWGTTMMSEYEALVTNKSWSLVRLQPTKL